MAEKTLTDSEVTRELENLPGWVLEGTALVREFKFSDFIEAFAFMTELAIVSEKLNHHPEWANVYDTVRIALTTHDVGGITAKDIKWATYCNQRYNQQM